MLTFSVFLIVLGLLVFIHELGHFLLAKRCGVGVETFSLGFGPRLFGRKRGETDYRISAIPLGGYVKMTGEDPADEDAQQNDSFAKKSVGARMKIVIAGPIMNLLLPFILMPLVYLIGIDQPAFLKAPPVIGWVAKDSPAEKAGFQRGDQIVKIGKKEIANWEKARITFLINPNKNLEVIIIRDNQPQLLQLTPEFSGIGGYVGLRHKIPPAIGSISPDMPAAEAGLQQGDLILSIEDKEVSHWIEMAMIIQDHPEKPLLFTIQRAEERFSVTIRPKRNPETDTGLLGISAPAEEMIFIRHSLWKSIKVGYQIIWDSFLQTFVVLGKLITGGLSMKTLGGPVKIAEMTGEAARLGLSSLIFFIAFLSLQLGILNLLPIPALDGGYVLFLTLEAILRRPVNRKFREISQQIGIMLLLFFILLITYNDIMNILPDYIKEFFNKLFDFF